MTRSVVDSRYRVAVKARISAANVLWGAPPAAPLPAGYKVIELSHPCKLNSPVVDTNSTVFVRCSGGPPNRTIAVENYVFGGIDSTVIFDRTVNIGSGNLLAATDARRVLVNGDLNNQGQLLINSGTASPAGTCVARQATAPARRAAVVLDGSFTSTGTGTLARLCSTTVILADCAVPNADGTAPVNNTCGDHLAGTGGTFEWLAPNAVSSAPVAADFDQLEDLALWGEARNDNSISGGVSMTLSGVFFLPNADAFELGGNGVQTVRNAQMVVRRLEVSGSSTFSFQPDPEDVVQIPFYGGVSLIR